MMGTNSYASVHSLGYYDEMYKNITDTVRYFVQIVLLLL